MKLIDIFHIGVNSNPNGCAVLSDKNNLQKRISYKRLKDISWELKDELSLSFDCHSEIIGVVMDTGIDLISLILGILLVPASFYTIDRTTLAAIERLEELITKLHIRIFVTDSEMVVRQLQNLSRFTFEIKSLKVLEVYTIRLRNVEARKYFPDISYVITTSGTTGTPKIVKVPNRCIAPNIVHIKEIYGLKTSDLVLQISPMTFDPSIVEIFTTLYAGATLLIPSDEVKMRPRELAAFAFQRHKVSVLQATPSLIGSFGAALMNSTILSRDSSLRILSFGGEPCPSGSTLKRWKEKGNTTRIINLYGITEVSSWATYYELTDQDIESENTDIPLGSALEETVLQILDINEEDSVGQLWIGGDKRVCLIDQEDDVTAKEIDGEEYVTASRMRFSGDLVRQSTDGMIYYVGRQDDMIKRNGKRIHLQEIEKIILKNSVMNRSVAVYDKSRLLLFVQPCESSDENIEQHQDENDVSVLMRNLLTRWLPLYYQPDDIVVLKDIPITAHGKVDKQTLLKLYDAKKFAVSSNPLFTRDSILHQMSKLWQTVLMLDDIKMFLSKGWTELGGNSIMALRLSNEIQSSFSIAGDRTMDVVLHSTSIHDAVNYVVSRMEQMTEKVDNDGDIPLKRKTTDDIGDTDVPLSHLEQSHNLNSISSPSKRLKLNGNEESPPQPSDNLYAISGTLNDENQNSNLVSDEDKNCSRFALGNILASFERGSNVRPYHCDKRSSLHCLVKGGAIPVGVCSSSDDERKIPLHQVGLDPSTTCQLDLSWKFDTKKCIDSSPLIALFKDDRGLVFIGSHSHLFAAVDLDSGEALWEIYVGDRIESSACLSLCGSYVIFGCYDGRVYVIETLNGKIFWSYQTGNCVKSSPCVNPANGNIYIGSHDGHVYCFNLQRKSCLWKRHLQSGSVFSSPCMNADCSQVVISTLGGYFFSLHPDSGIPLWQLHIGKPIFSTTVSISGGYCIGCVDGNVYCIEKNGSKKIWTYSTGGPVFSSPVVVPHVTSKQTVCTNVVTPRDSDGTKQQYPSTSHVSRQCSTNSTAEPTDQQHEIILIGSHDKHLYCLNGVDGHLVWKTQLDSEVYSTPFVFSTMSTSDVPSLDAVTVCSVDGILYIINIVNGEILAKHHFPGKTFSSPCVVNNKILVGCRDNSLYCLTIKFDEL